MKKTCLLIYIPVIHKGYIDLFKKLGENVHAFVIGDDLIKEFLTYREIRTLDPVNAVYLLREIHYFKHASLLQKDFATRGDFTVVLKKNFFEKVIMINDDLSRKIAEKYLQGWDVEFVDVFLRWDESNVNSSVAVNYDRISEDPFDRQMIEMARVESGKSSDWWRHIGALLVKDGKILLEAHNEHLPSEYTPYIDGDPRDFIKAGTNPEIRSAIHAEPRIIAEAARRGISVEGCDIYLTAFPCTPCAEIVACSGIKRLFFVSGNAYVNAESVLKSASVEIVFVQM